MKIERFRFGKGFEIDGKKEYLELEVRLPDTATDKNFQDEFMAAEYMIDNLLVGVPGMKKEGPTAKASNNAMLLMTFEEIEAQDWKASKWVRPMDTADRKARLGEDAYMPTTVADKRLIEMIKQSPNSKLVLPPYTEITFGGDGGLIIRKGPHAEKKK